MTAITDSAELLAQQHLISRFPEVTYEPDGNVAPDFLVNREIAVEVRRLNQNEVIDGKLKSLEQSSIPLSAKFEKLLKSFGPSKSGSSWFVTYSFHRPILSWIELEPLIRSELELFKQSPSYTPVELGVEDAFSLLIIPSTKTFAGIFQSGGYSDHDSLGWILSEFDRNLKLCIDQKSSKINRAKYEKWWLLLVDQIGYSLSKLDRQEFKSFFRFEHSWDRIIIVDPLDPTNFFEI